MGYVRFHHGKWHVTIPHPDGGRTPGGRPRKKSFATDATSEAEALAILEDLESEPPAPRVKPVTGTVEREAMAWCERLRQRDYRSLRMIEHHLRDYILPRFGHMRADKVLPRDVMEWVDDLRGRGKISGKTIRNIYGTLSSLMNDLEVMGEIDITPCRLGRYHLPPASPEGADFYAEHVFTRAEVETILHREGPYRIAYALGFLAGLRAGEVAGLTWGSIDRSARPLWRITVSKSYAGGTKTGDVRVVPAHPVLAHMLRSAEAPSSGELVVPRIRGGMLTSSAIWGRWKVDLEALMIDHRRFHDTRRTFVSMLGDEGVAPDLIRILTHRPNRGDSIQRYTTRAWEVLCEAVMRLDIQLERGQVLRLHRCSGADQ